MRSDSPAPPCRASSPDLVPFAIRRAPTTETFSVGQDRLILSRLQSGDRKLQNSIGEQARKLQKRAKGRLARLQSAPTGEVIANYRAAREPVPVGAVSNRAHAKGRKDKPMPL